LVVVTTPVGDPTPPIISPARRVTLSTRRDLGQLTLPLLDPPNRLEVIIETHESLLRR
jgi:hypothetical protein